MRQDNRHVNEVLCARSCLSHMEAWWTTFCALLHRLCGGMQLVQGYHTINASSEGDGSVYWDSLFGARDDDTRATALGSGHALEPLLYAPPPQQAGQHDWSQAGATGVVAMLLTCTQAICAAGDAHGLTALTTRRYCCA